MPSNDDAIAGLREALGLSPDNLPLRQTLAEMLLASGRYDEAEAEYRAALKLSVDSPKFKIGLATCFVRQGKSSLAVVLVEDVLKQDPNAAAPRILYAKILLAMGDEARAAQEYVRAVELDPTVKDAELERRLAIPAPPQPQPPEGTLDESGASGALGSFFGAFRTSRRQPVPDTAAETERPQISFSDVGGMDGVKEDIRMKIIHPLAHADLYKAYGKAIGGGILMYGPPGCGKTHLARATAGEIHASFMAVGINDVLDMWIGSSERNLHAIFEQARRRKPCVLFFDEVDALAASRADMRASAGRHMINQFLSEMDGIGTNNDGVLLLAATNAPWHVDPAFRRPGRFDKIIFVPPPDKPARAAILRIHLKGKPVGEIDHDQIAAGTNAYSGADMRALVEVAVEAKLREAMKSGRPTPLVTRDLLDAMATVKPSTHEWFASARNYAMYSNQAGTYDDVVKYLKM